MASLWLLDVGLGPVECRAAEVYRPKPPEACESAPLAKYGAL